MVGSFRLATIRKEAGCLVHVEVLLPQALLVVAADGSC